MLTRAADILLAEDNQKDASLVVSALEPKHSVRWVRNTRDLRTQFKERTPDMLILDVTLDNDGLEFFQSIRFGPTSPSGGVIMLTEEGNVAMRERANQLGATAVHPKPIDGAKLLETVDDLLSFVETEV
jgi:DNA-binding response OmpR family regulator